MPEVSVLLVNWLRLGLAMLLLAATAYTLRPPPAPVFGPGVVPVRDGELWEMNPE